MAEARAIIGNMKVGIAIKADKVGRAIFSFALPDTASDIVGKELAVDKQGTVFKDGEFDMVRKSARPRVVIMGSFDIKADITSVYPLLKLGKVMLLNNFDI